MDKMRMESLDMTNQNIEKIGNLFPNCITETIDENGKPKKVINFELLKQMLSSDVIEGDEKYEFTWVGKKASIVEANKPIRKTLRPCKEESINWDKTENLYIEGDNLEVLKLLQESYLGKVKMIYIDPPYNTGNDFVYNDDFKMTSKEYADESGECDEEGNRMFKNTDSNGRFHSDWCSMMYSRLMLARNLLSDDGVIFISIDDNEQQNMKNICNEIFGEDNFVAIIIWKKKNVVQNDAKFFSTDHEYLLCYAINATKLILNRLPRTDEQKSRYKNPDNDPRGDWTSVALQAKSGSSTYEITFPNGVHWKPVKGTFPRLSKESLMEAFEENRLWFGATGKNVPRLKKYLKEVKDGVLSNTIWFNEEVGSTQSSKEKLKKLLNSNVFDTPKPIEYVKKMIKLTCNKDSIILDFFSGSSTTAHAVMQLNAEDGGNRKFIMVQLPEQTDEKSEAYKAGYKNICEIGKERIRRAGKKLKESLIEHGQEMRDIYKKKQEGDIMPTSKAYWIDSKQYKDKNAELANSLDTGFRVFKLDETNMNDVYYSANEYSQDMLSMLESNVKSDRTDLDLLFGCLLEWGLQLSLPYCSEKIEGCTVHNYNDGDLIACYDENIPDTVIKAIAKQKPLRAVFRDSSFKDSSSKINVGEIFKTMSPDTTVKVI